MEKIIENTSQIASHQRSILILLVIITAISALFLIYKIIDATVPKLVKFLSSRVYVSSQAEKLLKWRRLETFIHVFIAAGKAMMLFFAVYWSWHAIDPQGPQAASYITASAATVILLSALVGPLLRDIAFGFVMIAERWFNVGDHIEVEPFGGLRGIVEGVTLRSTTLRGLNGEIIKIHNQHIQAIRMTPMGVRSLALDVFVKDIKAGTKLVERVLKTVPQDATMVKKQFLITEKDQISEGMWRITATGRTVAGREWLIENYATSAIKEADKHNVIVHGPIVRFADASAEKRFKRSVQLHN